ncbi:MAG: ribosomal protein S18-alanine N-acetyltransferase [Gemmatimonadales bacterium]
MAGRRKLRPDGSRPTDVPCRIRRGTPADAPALVAIERRAFGDPWSEASFREALTAAWSFGLVAVVDDEITGYLIAREAGGSGEILNLAVDPPRRRGGVGGMLLDAGLAVLRRRGAEEIFLEVRESNIAAQALYLGAGFRPVGQRADYYRNPMEDALVLRLGPSPQR